MRSIGTRFLAGSLSSLFASAALAQEWTIVNLGGSEGIGASGGQQVGSGGSTGLPGTWSGSADSWHQLSFPAGSYSWWYATGIDAGQVVGYGNWFDPPPDPSNGDDALLWRANGSIVYLGNGYFDDSSSAAYGISGSRVVGYRNSGPGTSAHAMMWTGPTFSRVDLHPIGATRSIAYGCYADQQVGYAVFGSQHAGLWTGTAASWVDLNPVGASSSIAKGVYAGEQVGFCIIGGISRACLWHGTAGSWVDLAPPGAQSSSASAVYEGMQVGSVQIGGVFRASLWRGSADSWVDLSAYLPPEFSGSSSATGISSDGEFIYVVGNAGGAVIWKTPVPCVGDLDGDRSVGLQDLALLLSHYGTPDGATPADGDLDGDGDVDLQDLANLLARFGSACQ